MHDQLRIHFNFDDDGTVELSVHAQANGFAGTSSAWFNVDTVVVLAERLAKEYPLPNEAPLELRGGYWGKKRGDGLTQEHVGLAFYPIGMRGIVGVRARLSTPLTGDVDGHQNMVALEIRTTYEALRQFATQLLAATRRKRPDAVLVASEH